MAIEESKVSYYDPAIGGYRDLHTINGYTTESVWPGIGGFAINMAPSYSQADEALNKTARNMKPVTRDEYDVVMQQPEAETSISETMSLGAATVDEGIKSLSTFAIERLRGEN